MPLRPNRYRLPNGELTPAQERGKAIFERTAQEGRHADSRSQPVLRVPLRSALHQPATGGRRHRQADRPLAADRRSAVDQHGLHAPYLHDGSARTLEEIWTVFNPNDTHGVTQRSDER